MDGADIARAEHILEIRRHRREAAAIHADDDQEAEHEQVDVPATAGVGHGDVEQEAETHIDEVGVLTSDVVRQRRPAEATAHIKQAHQTDQAGRGDGRDVAGEHFLAHRGSLAQHADASSGVEEQHRPDQPELRCLDRIVDEDVVLGDQLGGSRRRHITVRLPARGGDANNHRTDHHEDEVGATENDEGFQHADVSGRGELVHQPDRQRRGDQRAAAEAHDGHPGRHARTIWKPLHQRRDRRDVADAECAAAEHAVAQIDDPELVQGDADGRNHEAAGPQDARREHRLAWSAFLDPAAEHGRRHAEGQHRDGEDPSQLGQFPVARCGRRNAEQFGHRQIEYAEGVGLSDA